MMLSKVPLTVTMDTIFSVKNDKSQFQIVNLEQ